MVLKIDTSTGKVIDPKLRIHDQRFAQTDKRQR